MSRCQESSSPIGALAAAIAAERAIIAGSRFVTSAAAAGGAISIPRTSRDADHPEADHDRERDHDEQDELQQVDPHAERRRPLAIEGEEQERPVEHGDQAEHARGEHGGRDHVAAADPEDVAEQERGEIDRVALRARDQDHAEREHEDEDDGGRRLLAQAAAAQDRARRRRGHEARKSAPTAIATSFGSAPVAASPAVSMKAIGDPREDAVGEAVGHQRHPAQDDVAADDGAQDPDERRGERAVADELRLEGIDEEVHPYPAPW